MALPVSKSLSGIAAGQSLPAFDSDFTVIVGRFEGDSGGGSIVGNSTFAAGDGVAYLNTDVPNADQWCELLVSAPNGTGSNSAVGPAVRVSATGTCYAAIANSNGSLFLNRYVNGVYVAEVASNASVSLPALIRLEVEGTTLRVFVNGSLLITQTDANIASGYLGIVNYQTGSGSEPVGNDFAGSNIVTIALEQEGFRFGADDGNEASHSWIAAQDTNVSLSPGDSAILNVLVNVNGSVSPKAFRLQYRKVGDALWQDVPLE